jgi:hypothetical protein
VRNATIQERIARDLPSLKLTFTPEYNPFLKGALGIAKEGEGVQLGRSAFNSDRQLVETIVHEELHHRWWARGLTDHHSLELDQRFEATVARYMRMRGF